MELKECPSPVAIIVVCKNFLFWSREISKSNWIILRELGVFPMFIRDVSYCTYTFSERMKMSMNVGASKLHFKHLSFCICLIQILRYGNNRWHPEIVLPAHSLLTLKISNIYWACTMCFVWHSLLSSSYLVLVTTVIN